MSRIRQILLEGVVSTDNSSESILTASAVFTGDWVEILHYGTIFVSVFADQDGELSVEQSTDGINADFCDCYTIFANDSKNYAINPHAKYIRIGYANGITDQTAFRLQTILKGNSTPSSHKINDDIKGQDDSRLVTSVLKVQTNDSNTYRNVDVQNPLPTDGDSVYAKDLRLDLSASTGWTGLNTDNTLEDLFKELDDGLTNIEVTNPKQLYIYFRRAVISTGVIALATVTGTFSNTKISVIEGATTTVVYDGSADSSAVDFLLAEFTPRGFTGILIEFYTANTVTLTEVGIEKNIAVNAQLRALKDDSTLVQIGATDTGNLKVTDAEAGFPIAKGEVEGHLSINKFGAAPDFDTADGFVTVWDGADDANIDQMLYQYSTTADIDTISSSDNTDTQDIEIEGLDTNYDLVTQTVTLTGQAQALLTTPLIRVFRMKNVGSTDNAGHVYLYTNGTTATLGVPDTAANTRAIIQPGNNQTLMAIYTVPSGHTGYMVNWYANIVGASKTSNYPIELRARPFGQVFQIKHASALAEEGSSNDLHEYFAPKSFDEKTDIEMRAAMTAVGGSQGSVGAGFDIIIVEN